MDYSGFAQKQVRPKENNPQVLTAGEEVLTADYADSHRLFSE
jgi:hypothetical protein